MFGEKEKQAGHDPSKSGGAGPHPHGGGRKTGSDMNNGS